MAQSCLNRHRGIAGTEELITDMRVSHRIVARCRMGIHGNDSQHIAIAKFRQSRKMQLYLEIPQE